MATEVVYGHRRSLFKNLQLMQEERRPLCACELMEQAQKAWQESYEKALGESEMSSEVYETKWGFVAYSYEDYKKLKQLNKIFWKARRNAAAWNRWARKQPQNRVQKKWIRNEKGQKIGYEIVGPLPEPNVCELFSKKHRWFDCYVTDNKIEEEYRKSRKPVPTEEEVEKPGFLSSEIDDLLREAEKWHNSL